MKLLVLCIGVTVVTLFMISCKDRSSQKLDLPSDAFLVDVRTSKEFESGSVPGAVNIPLDQVESSLEVFSGKENIVVFCRSGNRSGKAKKILESAGILNVINGGGWKEVLSRME